MTPCSTTAWGCAFNCEANTFPVSPGLLQITEANYAELGINNVTASPVPSISTPVSTPAVATMPTTTTPTNTVAPGCAIALAPNNNASIVGVGIGVPLGLAFAITTLLFLNERRKLLKIRRSRMLILDNGPTQIPYQVPDPAKLQSIQAYTSQLPYQRSYQQSYQAPLHKSTFHEAGSSQAAEEMP